MFDVHFLLRGNQAGYKPLKAYYRARIDFSDDKQLKKLVCGTLFSAKRGRVLDLAREVVSLVKGWMPHKIGGKIVWEAPLEALFDGDGNELPPPEPAVGPVLPQEDPLSWTRHVNAIFKAIGGKKDTDAALIVYCLANGIRPYNEVVWKYLDVGAGMANRRFHQAVEAMASYMKRKRLTLEDVDFASALIDAAKRQLGESVVMELETSR